MKKIFAFILASIMVLSLVPASVFAAFTNEYDCLETHTIATCDKAGISYSVVKVVAASCTAGYTVYKCDDCGDQFFGNFVDGTGHVWENDEDEDHEDVSMKCKSGETRDGKSWVRCSVCGETGEVKCNCGNGKCDKGYNVTEWKHIAKSQTGVGCETIYTCKSCDVKYYAYIDDNGVEKQITSASDTAALHVWEYVSITKEPTVSAPGLASYKCTKCGDTREFNIKYEHDCKWVCKVTAADPTCTKDGTLGLWECSVCGDVKYTKNNKAPDKSGVTIVTAAQFKNDYNSSLIRPKYNHINPDSNGITWLDPSTKTYIASNSCVVSQYCYNCKNHITYTEHRPGKAQEIAALSSPATCTKAGYKTLMCAFCNTTERIDLPALGHDFETFEIDSTKPCAVPGEVITVCKNANCDATPVLRFDGTNYTNKYNNYVIVDIAKLPLDTSDSAHSIKEITIGGATSCAQGVTIYKYCENGCSTYVPSVTMSGAIGHKTKTVEYVTYENGVHYKTTIVKCLNTGCTYAIPAVKVPVSLPAHYADLNDVKFYHGVKAKITTAKEVYDLVDTDKVIGYTYEVTYDFYRNIDECKNLTSNSKLPGNLADDDWIVKPSCTAEALGTIKCDACGINCLIKQAPGKHTGTKIEQVAPLHNRYGYESYYVCVCGVKYIEKDGVQTVITTVPTIPQCYHVFYNDIGTLKAGTALKNCNGEAVAFYWVCKEDHSNSSGTQYKYFIQTLDKPVAGNAVYTVDFNKAITTYTNKESSFTSAYPDKLDNHKFGVVAGTSALTANCNTDGVAKVEYCAVCDSLKLTAIYDAVDTAVGKDKTFSVSYTYSDIIENSIVPYVDAETGHQMIKFFGSDKDYVYFDLQVGKLNHEYYTVTEVAEGEDEISKVATKDDVTSFNSAYLTANDAITSRDFKAENDAEAGTVGTSYTLHSCALCDYALIDDYVAAHAHVNKNGESLFDSCANADVDERWCVVCKRDITISAHESSKLVEASVEADCVTEGYTYKFCKVCGWYDVTGVNYTPVDPYNHADPVEDKDLNYAQNGYRIAPCNACGFEGKDYTLMTEKGVELVLDITVNGREGEVATFGSKIDVTVSLASLNGVEVWGVDFALAYNPELVKFEKASWNTAGCDIFGLATEKQKTYNVPDYVTQYNNYLALLDEYRVDVEHYREDLAKWEDDHDEWETEYAEWVVNYKTPYDTWTEAKKAYDEYLEAYAEYVEKWNAWNADKDNLTHPGAAPTKVNDPGAAPELPTAPVEPVKPTEPTRPTVNTTPLPTKELKDAAGIIQVVGNANDKGVEVKGKVELITLSFTALYTEKVGMGTALHTDGYLFQVGNVEDYTTDDSWANYYTATIIDDNGDDIASMYNETNEASVEYAMNFNLAEVGFGKITIKDAREIYALILFNNYNVVADVDADGDVDAEDMRVFYSVLTGVQTLEDLFEKGSIGTGSLIQPRND